MQGGEAKIYLLTMKRLKINRGMVLFSLAALAILLVMPREARFRYEYQRGAIWKHDNLLAPFGFAVFKSGDQLSRERDSALASYNPVFTWDENTARRQLAAFGDAFSSAWLNYSLEAFDVPSAEAYLGEAAWSQHRKLEEACRTLLTLAIDSIYNRGIVDLSPLEQEGTAGYRSLTVVRNNFAEERAKESLYTPLTAYARLNSELTSSLPKTNRQLLQRYEAFFRNFRFNDYLSANVVYDAELSEGVRNNLLEGISLTRGLVQEGQSIISKGETVTDEKFLILESLRRVYEQNVGRMAGNLVLLGKLLLVIALLSVLYFFLLSFRPEVLESAIRTAFLLLTLTLMVTIAALSQEYGLASLYLLPFTLLPVIVKTFYDARIALFVHIIAILLTGFFAPNGFEFVLLNIVAGMVAIISLTNAYSRSRLVLTAMFVTLAYSFVYVGIALVQEGSFREVNLNHLRWFGINGILVLLAYPLIYIFEKSFGFTSDATLLELSNSNQPLLRKLAELAPGTFQHSLQVANLAENAIFRIGGNTLLVRTGALYHDIGKMEDPQYFTENQTTGINPHDRLQQEESARIIIGHVSKGVALARKFRLPEVVTDFIRMHHGTGRVKYFYRSFVNNHPGTEVDPAPFSYPGPRPRSRETAVVMMADAVEAASRSLAAVDAKTLDSLVDSIIGAQMAEEQYNDAGITFRDISQIKEEFKKGLENIYHVRITYPA